MTPGRTLCNSEHMKGRKEQAIWLEAIGVALSVVWLAVALWRQLEGHGDVGGAGPAAVLFMFSVRLARRGKGASRSDAALQNPWTGMSDSWEPVLEDRRSPDEREKHVAAWERNGRVALAAVWLLLGSWFWASGKPVQAVIPILAGVTWLLRAFLGRQERSA